MAMQILRHSKIAVTMEIYTEVPSTATRAALRKLSQWLGSPVRRLPICVGRMWSVPDGRLLYFRAVPAPDCLGVPLVR
jgi:hypothetical protein